ncbi:MAG: OHCU decarboxylase [Martelella sp.]|uniref:2-oxo-4-hydroxy-4-carboxy-5-ureidoimidazoline decarboxylase n=1 Tax=unclassified Martelella TaxID=2629616 RepID=UPI000C404954|nr:2-oxo-4-hydroxy-4-carboxy-5-ureidoimidazoline decarboxylase [Martelella sp.]MAU23226.1 OHCU decarboxylase [Martelella sp.]|tara:strand:- start:247 stop:801 length:555 start_codon:yes stop_codon:yes gene_type:complete
MNSAIMTLNAAADDQALSIMEPLVERSAWVCEASLAARPFADSAALAEALMETIYRSGMKRQRALFAVHPELAGSEAMAGRMTAASTGEQARLGLLALSREEAARLAALNTAYSARFGYPFIIALHRVPDLGTLFETFARRLDHSALEEHALTLAEIASVIESRVNRLFGGSPASSLAQAETLE